jgi:hypothetical protein
MDGDDRAIMGAPVFAPETSTLQLGRALAARPVSAEMWSYQQGSYPVLRHYLEQRQGRALETQEFDDFRDLAAAVAGTLQRLPRIDALARRAAGDSFAADDLGLPQQVAD